MILLIVAFVAHLLMGVVLCIKGKLALDITYDVAMTAAFNKPSTRKLRLYQLGLRLAVVLGWPVFWLSS